MTYPTRSVVERELIAQVQRQYPNLPDFNCSIEETRGNYTAKVTFRNGSWHDSALFEYRGRNGWYMTKDWND